MVEILHNRNSLKLFRKNLRNNLTLAEKKLWYYLRNSSLQGHKFRRQHSVGPYILDFYCPAKKLAIEIDGDSHFQTHAAEYDLNRTQFLEKLNIRVLRFLNTEVHENVLGVCNIILDFINAPLSAPAL